MNYLNTMKTRTFISIIALILLFHFYGFLKNRLANIYLPKGKIVFYSPADGHYEIYTMRIDGSKMKKLTHNVSNSAHVVMYGDPSFSPSGNEIVFTSNRQYPQNREIIYNINRRPIGEKFSGGGSDVFIMDSEGKYQKPLTYQELNSAPFFSPDGNNIVFTSHKGRNLLEEIISVYGANRRLLNTNPGHCKFSPDGNKIFDTFQCDLSVMNIDGSGRARLTNLLTGEEKKEPRLRKLHIYNFAFSNDAGKIVFVLDEKKGTSLGEFHNIVRLYTMNVDGSDLKVAHMVYILSLSYPYSSEYDAKVRFCDIRQLQYSSDDQAVIFIADLTYKKGIYLLNLRDGEVKELTCKKKIWRQILDFSLTPDGKRIVFVADIYPIGYALRATIFRDFRAWINYYLFKKSTPFYDNKYLCIMDIDGKNYRRIAKLPVGTELGRDFIHWE